MRKKIAVWICTASMLAMTGCGDKAQEEPVVNVDKIDEPQQNTDQQTSDDNVSDNEESGSNEEEKNEENNPETDTGDSQNMEKPADLEMLNGNITSIGESGVVISKTFTEDLDNGSHLAYSPAEGSDDEVLITVNFSDDTKFELKTVKNSGVNGDSDVTITNASFSDLVKDVSVEFSGYYISDSEFQADTVIIYNFV